MRAVTFQEVGRMSVETVADPRIEAATDVILQITTAAICGSDLHLLHGDIPLPPGYICGHEYVGIVVDAGPAVSAVQRGDRVLGAFHVACGNCATCRNDRFHLCRKGGVLGYGPLMGNLPGTQAELARIPFADSTLRKIPEGLAEDKALFCGDVLTTAYGAVRNAELRPGEIAAVIGCGPVGLMAVQSAFAQGAARVIAIDMLDDRLALAARFGAETVNAAAVQPAAAVRDLTRKAGADVVIEAAGGPKTIAMAFDIVAGGGRISAVGVSSAQSFEFPLLLGLSKDIGFRIGLANIHRDIDAVMGLVRSGRIDPTPVISHHMKLADAAAGYALFDQRRAMKILLQP